MHFQLSLLHWYQNFKLVYPLDRTKGADEPLSDLLPEQSMRLFQQQTPTCSATTPALIRLVILKPYAWLLLLSSAPQNCAECPSITLMTHSLQGEKQIV